MIDESVDTLPANLRPREFKVGDRVRVRLSAECRRFNGRRLPGDTWLFGHSDACDGLVGVVDTLHDDQYGHPIFAVFRDLDNEGGFFEAIELEPLDDES